MASKTAYVMTTGESPSPTLLSDSNPDSGTLSTTWIIDTGATDHMTFDSTVFSTLSPKSHYPYITSANGAPSNVAGEGTISLSPKLSLPHTLLVPSIKCNLLSVGKFLDSHNCYATFYPSHCKFQDLTTHETIGHGKWRGGLYILTVSSPPRAVHVQNSRAQQQIWLWHRRLGHPSFGYLQRLFPSLFQGLVDSQFKCETCVLAKSHRTVFPSSDSKTEFPFELIHSDVWGPAKVSSTGKRWFVTFIDECTRMTWVYLLAHKSDVTTTVREFHAMITTQFQASIKVFRSDNGGEYVNGALAQFFKDKGIIHQTSTPFTPQQNGVAERKNRQLLEVARAYMLDKSVPHHLWGHALLSAVYVINRVPSSVLNFQTPLDTLAHHISLPTILKLPPRVFGCVVYAHVPTHQRSKLDPCALRCVFIGYGLNQKGYKCYHPPTQKIFVTIDTIFHEDLAYFMVSKTPSLQGERGSEEKDLSFEENIEKNAEENGEVPQATGRHPTCDRSCLHRVEDSHEVPQATDRDPSTTSREVPHATGCDTFTTGRFDTETNTNQIPLATGREEPSDRSLFHRVENSEENYDLSSPDLSEDLETMEPKGDPDAPDDQLQNTTPHALPSHHSSSDEEVLEVTTEPPNVAPYTLPPRSTRGKPKPQYCPDLNAKSKYPINNHVSTHRLSKSYASFVNQLSTVCVPSKWQDAVTDSRWTEAMTIEMEALNKNSTWEMVPLPHGKKPVGCRWIYTVKYKADGSIDRYKARLVAKGYTQTYGIDYQETFAPVAKINTVRVLISLAANLDWPLLQYDVKNAFLHGDLQEEIYMDPPPGIPMTSGPNTVCKLRKSLYGLKQSPRAWFGRFTNSMKRFGYTPSSSDHTLFFKRRGGKLTALIIYVDDMVVTGNDNEEMQNLQKLLGSEFEMKELGELQYFLGIEVARSKHDIFLSQRKYVLDLLTETGMLDCKPADTPIEQNHKLGM
ncbi:hypothetical protein CerSpe_286040 [Prunus speciosa]